MGTAVWLPGAAKENGVRSEGKTKEPNSSPFACLEVRGRLETGGLVTGWRRHCYTRPSGISLKVSTAI